jgi:hypothetical protein
MNACFQPWANPFILPTNDSPPRCDAGKTPSTKTFLGHTLTQSPLPSHRLRSITGANAPGACLQDEASICGASFTTKGGKPRTRRSPASLLVAHELAHLDQPARHSGLDCLERDLQPIGDFRLTQALQKAHFQHLS